MVSLDIVVGGQFGSEAKGHVAAQLAKDLDTVVAIRVAGPNAGHTAVDSQGRAWKLRHLPVAAVMNPECELHISAGSEIDPEVLQREVQELEDAGIEVHDRLYVDPAATVIEPRHQTHENGLVNRIGSTGKGIGAARSDRIMRTARTWKDVEPEWSRVGYIEGALPERALQLATRVDGNIVIEGTQGYGLGLHTRYYPYVTSSDCRAIDFLAMAGISPWSLRPEQLHIWVVFRTYPIRVAGNSGPMHEELTWEQLAERTNGHIKPEQTTVTGKTRRIGEWDPRLARDAMYANGHPSRNVHPVLTFVDYWFPELVGCEIFPEQTEHPELHQLLRNVETAIQKPIEAITTGPATIAWRDL